MCENAPRNVDGPATCCRMMAAFSSETMSAQFPPILPIEASMPLASEGWVPLKL